MWRLLATVLVLVLGAGCGGGTTGGSVDAGPGCSTRKDCGGDRYCDVTTHVCVPFGVGTGTTFDTMCTRDVVAMVRLSRPRKHSAAFYCWKRAT